MRANDKQGLTLMHHAVLTGSDFIIKKIIEIFKEKSEYVNAINNQGLTPIHYAISTKDTGMIQTVIDAYAKANVDLNPPDKEGRTPLLYAATMKPIIKNQITDMMIKNNVNIITKNNFGNTIISSVQNDTIKPNNSQNSPRF